MVSKKAPTAKRTVALPAKRPVVKKAAGKKTASFNAVALNADNTAVTEASPALMRVAERLASDASGTGLSLSPLASADTVAIVNTADVRDRLLALEARPLGISLPRTKALSVRANRGWPRRGYSCRGLDTSTIEAFRAREANASVCHPHGGRADALSSLSALIH